MSVISTQTEEVQLHQSGTRYIYTYNVIYFHTELIYKFLKNQHNEKKRPTDNHEETNRLVGIIKNDSK
jgi:hypothetical protein